MTTENIYEFLQNYDPQDLLEQGVLRGDATRMLQARSIQPLINLMNDAGVTRLEFPEHSWFLDVEGNFENPRSGEATKGTTADLQQPGNVFNYQNKTINPHFRQLSDAEDLPEGLEEAEKLTLRLEGQLQAFLREHLEDLEPGLRAIDEGKEQTVATGRIDIMARDRENQLVVIELKAAEANDSALTQLLGYMAAVTGKEEQPVRGILVAGGFSKRLRYASQVVSTVQLKRYEFRFSFETPQQHDAPSKVVNLDRV